MEGVVELKGGELLLDGRGVVVKGIVHYYNDYGYIYFGKYDKLKEFDKREVVIIVVPLVKRVPKKRIVKLVVKDNGGSRR